MKNKHMENIRYRQIESVFPAGIGVNRKNMLKSAPSFDIFVDNCVYLEKKHFQFLEGIACFLVPTRNTAAT